MCIRDSYYLYRIIITLNIYLDIYFLIYFHVRKLLYTVDDKESIRSLFFPIFERNITLKTTRSEREISKSLETIFRISSISFTESDDWIYIRFSWIFSSLFWQNLRMFMQLVRMHLWVRKVFELFVYYFNILLDHLSNNL